MPGDVWTCVMPLFNLDFQRPPLIPLTYHIVSPSFISLFILLFAVCLRKCLLNNKFRKVSRVIWTWGCVYRLTFMSLTNWRVFIFRFFQKCTWLKKASIQIWHFVNLLLSKKIDKGVFLVPPYVMHCGRFTVEKRSKDIFGFICLSPALEIIGA